MRGEGEGGGQRRRENVLFSCKKIIFGDLHAVTYRHQTCCTYVYGHRTHY